LAFDVRNRKEKSLTPNHIGVKEKSERHPLKGREDERGTYPACLGRRKRKE